MMLRLQNMHKSFLNTLWNSKNTALIEKHIAPAAHIQTIFLSGTGPNVLQEEIKKTFQAFDSFSFKVTSIKQVENELFYTWQGQGKHVGTLWSFKPSLDLITFQGLGNLSVQIETGLINRFCSFSDLPNVLSLQAEQLLLSKQLQDDWQILAQNIQQSTNSHLTRREIECLKLWINGYSIKETARFLNGISLRTVQTFRENLKRKLRVKTYQQLLQIVKSFDLSLSNIL